MATYKEIQDYIKENHGYVAKTCWIAHTKELVGISKRIAPNRIDKGKRVYLCPESKVEDIKEAFKHFEMM